MQAHLISATVPADLEYAAGALVAVYQLAGLRAPDVHALVEAAARQELAVGGEGLGPVGQSLKHSRLHGWDPVKQSLQQDVKVVPVRRQVPSRSGKLTVVEDGLGDRLEPSGQKPALVLPVKYFSS